MKDNKYYTPTIDEFYLGLETSPDEPDEWFWAYKGNKDKQLYFDVLFNTNNGIGIQIYDDRLIFSGYIKNKSELKKLMKQLGIYEDNN